jgi:chromate transporter
MYRDLVERRRWIGEDDYKEGLTLAQLMPGPLAAQLAMYLGYVHYRIVGATVVGVAFVLPSFLMVVAIGWAYLRYGGLPWMQSAFYGVGAAVIGIIAISAYKLTAKNIGRDKLLWAIYLATAGFTVWTQSESVWLFLGGGVLAWLVRAAPKRWLGRSAAPVVAAVSTQASPTAAVFGNFDWTPLATLGVFFAKAGAFVFGSGLAIVPFLYAGVVHDHQWLNERQFVDAVAVAMITPGPVVITVGFIGYLIAGLPGAIVAALGTFLPCYVFTILPAPYFKKYGKRPALVAFGRDRCNHRCRDRPCRALDRRCGDRRRRGRHDRSDLEGQEAAGARSRCGRRGRRFDRVPDGALTVPRHLLGVPCLRETG